MQKNRIAILSGLVYFLSCGPAPAVAGDDIQVYGMIVSRTGETLIINGENGPATVVLTSATTTKDDSGLFALGNQEMADIVLIPGLRVKIDAESDNMGRVIAKAITVDDDDLEASQMIQAGLRPTAGDVAGNMQRLAAHQTHIEADPGNIEGNHFTIQQNRENAGATRDLDINQQKIEQNIKDIREISDRFARLSDYALRVTATVKFAPGSSNLSPADMAKLQELAQEAASITGYLVEVMGFADSNGDALVNEKLSGKRAKMVIAYLVQECNIPAHHIVAPGAMGVYEPVAAKETKEGHAENRRVEVKVLINKVIAGA